MAEEQRQQLVPAWHRQQRYLPQELGVRVDELTVLLLQLRVADLGGIGFL